jgi:hypothetical protein
MKKKKEARARDGALNGRHRQRFGLVLGALLAPSGRESLGHDLNS